MPVFDLLRSIDAAVMPRRCAFCGTRTTASEGFVCTGCIDDLPWTGMAPAASDSPLESEWVPLAYEFPVDAAIKALKFRRQLYYGPALAQLLHRACDNLPPDIDAVLPVPLHWRRQWWRGFNQALEIAKPVARHLGLPVIRSVDRCRATRPQAGLSATERQKNVRKAFAVRRRIAERHVLVIDDVVTTGSTVRQVAGALLRHGAERVSALAVARA